MKTEQELMELARKRATAGQAFLDKHRPGWDVEMQDWRANFLNVSLSNHCVVAAVCGTCYTEGCDSLGITEDTAWQFGFEEFCGKNGEVIDDGVTYDMLTKAHLELLAQRRKNLKPKKRFFLFRFLFPLRPRLA